MDADNAHAHEMAEFWERQRQWFLRDGQVVSAFVAENHRDHWRRVLLLERELAAQDG